MTESQSPTNENGNSESVPSAPLQRDERVTVRLLVDRLPRDPVKFTDGRSFTAIWGMELDPQGKARGRRQVKLWNRSGTALLSVMKQRNLGTKNPMTIDLTGFLKADRKDPSKKVLDAQVFQIVGEPERLKSRNGPDSAGQKAPKGIGAMSARPAKSRDAERKPAEIEAVITGILNTPIERDGAPVEELTAFRMKEWNSPNADRSNESAMFRVRLAGALAHAAKAVDQAAAWLGYDMDIDHPVMVKLQGRWQKVEDPEGELARYSPWLFMAETLDITKAPNLNGLETTTFSSRLDTAASTRARDSEQAL